jgi:hypothetical protein
MIHRKKFCLVALLAIFLSATGFSAVDNVFIRGNTTAGGQITFQGLNSSPVSESAVLEPPRGFSKSLQWQKNDEGVQIVRGVSENPGVFSLSYGNNEKRFATGSNNLSVYARAVNISKSAPLDRNRCPFNDGDYACEYEHYQGLMMMAQATAFLRTNVSEHRENALRFALGWNETHGYAFDSYQDDTPYAVCMRQGYDCVTAYEVSAGERQGRAIQGLWKTFQATGNSSVKERAFNFTLGSPDGCDVWSGTYECNTTAGHAAMMDGFWTAYAVTGNQTFENIAKNLSATDRSAPEVGLAFWTAYRSSGNQTYLENAREITENYSEACDSCESRNRSQAILGLMDSYESTTETSYYREAIRKMGNSSKSTCVGFEGNSSCKNPENQAWAVLSAWKTFSNYVSDRPIVDTDIRDLQTGQDFQPEYGSYSSGLELLLEGPDTLEECEESAGSCVFNHSYTANQTAYRLLLNTSSDTFRLPFSSSLRDEKDLNRSGNYTGEGPSSYCRVWNGSTMCESVKGQAEMIEGFTDYLEVRDNQTVEKKLVNISNGPYYSRDTYDGCAPENNNFSCSKRGDPESTNIDDNPEGSERQGAIIKALYSSWELTGNTTTYEIARNFTEASPEDCNVWEDDYTCNSSEGQGRMAIAFWKAYTVTGDRDYRNVAENLTSRIHDYNITPVTARALWKGYQFTGNGTYLEDAENMTDYIGSACTDCDPYMHGKRTQLYSTAFRTTSSESYRESLRTLGNFNYSEYCDGFSCEYPSEQGSIISSLMDFHTVLDVERDVDTSFSVDSSTLTVGEETQAVCSATNLMSDTTLVNTTIEVSAAGISVDNGFRQVGDLDYLEQAEESFTLTAEQEGDHDVSCQVSSEGYTEEMIETVTVEQQENDTDDSDDSSTTSGSTTGGFSPSPTPDPYPEIYNYSVETRNLSMIVENTSSWRNASGCFTAIRYVRESNSTLNFNYQCSNDTGIVLYDFQDVNSSPVNLSGNVNYGFYNTTDLPVNWTYSEQTSDTLPGVAYRRSEKDEPEPLRLNISNVSDANTTRFQVELSRPAGCGVYRNSSLEAFHETQEFIFQPDIREGWNNFTLQCENVSRTLAVYEQPKEEEESLPAGLYLFSMLLLIGGVLFVYRDRIIGFYHQKLLDRKFENFRSAVETSDTEEARRIYEEMNSGEESSVLFSRAVKVYQTLDLVSEGVENNLEMDSEMAEVLGENFLKDCDDELLERLIEEKMKEIRP